MGHTVQKGHMKRVELYIKNTYIIYAFYILRYIIVRYIIVGLSSAAGFFNLSK
jgi:hypothetical protein